ncbi:MAG: CehA/McbA family metallohydrolase [Candidatus Latescibacterota bacterium]|nr:CehA/McbA family metallohydrolase [Candidatus Latescibacterota bacterium]
MARLKGAIRDEISAAKVPAKVHVLNSGGRFVHPADSLLKVGPGDPFFYCDGDFEVVVPRGAVDIVVERGTEYTPLRQALYAPSMGSVEVDLTLVRWIDLPEQRWYPGNTHIHYDELEDKPEERLRLEPEVNDLSATAVSILQRGQIPYASNKFPIGFMTDFSTDHRQVDCGEETRHNSSHGGYGHVMLLNLRNLVEPVSRGDLVSAFDPDYPPLCHACDDAKTQGGIVIWCHNGRGMEAPVAAGLGKLDAFNLFDPCWKDLEYDIWYKLLNCGIRLPASTGSDWYVCSNNRVYVQTEDAFSYTSWLAGLKAGRTFITNGPALWLVVEGQGPGAQIAARGRVVVEMAWRSHYPLDRVEVVRDGEVVDTRVLQETAEQREGAWSVDVDLAGDGWVAARVFGAARDSFGQAVYAHASPVYVGTGVPAERAGDAAAFFARGIEESSGLIGRFGRFTTDAQREEVLHLFAEGRKVYAKLEKEHG